MDRQQFPRTQKHLVPEDGQDRIALVASVLLELWEGRMVAETVFHQQVSMWPQNRTENMPTVRL
jgi:hypothetical protein